MAQKETTVEMLSMLEERLRRIDYILNGRPNGDFENPLTPDSRTSATMRLKTLERALQTLASKSSAVSDILALQRRHPELFDPTTPLDATDALPTSTLAAIVLAHSQLYHSASTKLPQVHDTSIPDSAVAAKLIELRPRINQLHSTQKAQMATFAELRTRSARVVEAWYEGGVLNMGEHWAEWEERLRDAEIVIRRREAAKKREEAAT